jgi:hypothetical protein
VSDKPIYPFPGPFDYIPRPIEVHYAQAVDENGETAGQRMGRILTEYGLPTIENVRRSPRLHGGELPTREGLDRLARAAEAIFAAQLREVLTDGERITLRLPGQEPMLVTVRNLVINDDGSTEMSLEPVPAAHYPGALPPDDQDDADARCPSRSGDGVPAQAVRPAAEADIRAAEH